MHWLLSVPETFSLHEVIQRSGWLLRPPFHIRAMGVRLYRIESLETSQTVGVTLYQVPAGLVLETESHLSGQEIEELSEKSWRMLRLEENFQPFLRLAKRTPALESVKRLGARLLRGTSLFEDVLTAASVSWKPNGLPDFDPVGGLVDRLGRPYPRNPTLHAFPSPEQVLKGAHLLQETLEPWVAQRIQQIADTFETRSNELETLTDHTLPSSELALRLQQMLSLDKPSVGLLMLSLGRYDYIPIDPAALQRMHRGEEVTTENNVQEILRILTPWQPWGGLAGWLYDWTKVPTLTHVS